MRRSDNTFSVFLPSARGSRDAEESGGTQSGGFAATPCLPLATGEDVWWVRGDGNNGVILSLALILVVKFLGGGGARQAGFGKP
jgi:hypothetical protein